MVTECLSIRSFSKHILDYYDTKEILLVFQREKKIGKENNFPENYPDFPVTGLSVCQTNILWLPGREY